MYGYRPCKQDTRPHATSTTLLGVFSVPYWTCAGHLTFSHTVPAYKMPTSRRESGEAADTEPRPGEEQEELQPLSAIRFPPEEEAVSCISYLPAVPSRDHLYGPIPDLLVSWEFQEPCMSLAETENLDLTMSHRTRPSSPNRMPRNLPRMSFSNRPSTPKRFPSTTELLPPSPITSNTRSRS